MDKLVDFLLHFYGPIPYYAVFIILLGCGLGVPIPEDITLIAAGIISYYGVADVGVMTLVAFAGIVIGDVMIFYLGAHYGRKLTKKWFFNRLLNAERLETVKQKFHKWGNKLIFAARFMPGLRAPVYFSAGTLHLPFRIFIFYDGLAAMISVPAIIFAVYFFGDQVDLVIKRIQKVESGIVIVLFLVAAAIGMKWYVTRRRLNKARRAT